MKEHYKAIQDLVLKEYGYKFGFINDLKAIQVAICGNDLTSDLYKSMDEVISVIILAKTKAVEVDMLAKSNPDLIYNHTLQLFKIMEIAKERLTPIEIRMYRSAFVIVAFTVSPFLCKVKVKRLKF